MTYTANVPVTGNSLGGTRDIIRSNFQQIATVEAINHVAFNELGQGKHKFLQMPEVTASGAGVPTTSADEAGFYAEVGNGVSQLFMRRESNGVVLQLTASDVSNTTAQASSGYSCLPGGLLIEYGSFGSESSSATRTVTFPKPFSVTPYSITITPTKAGTVATVDAYVQLPTASGFTIRHGDGHSWDYFWIAIGKA